MSWADDEGYWYDPEDMRPSIEFEDGEWTDADGNTKQISDMSTFHVKNCIGVLERTQEKWDYPDYDLKEIKHKIREFKDELKRRNNFKNKELF